MIGLNRSEVTLEVTPRQITTLVTVGSVCSSGVWSYRSTAVCALSGIRLLHRMGTPSRSNLASVEERVAYWAESGEDLIVNELINGYGEESVLMARAIKAFKEQYPHIWLAIWCSPSPLESYH